MITTNHVDFSKVVMNHFARTHKLDQRVMSLNPGEIEELIDAVPDSNAELIEALRNLLRREGVCVIH